MEDHYLEADITKRLILAGMRELDEHGAADFSLRRVAQMCGLSCAAPYRHFKSRDALLLAIIRYVNAEWKLLFDQMASLYASDLGRLIRETCAATIRFFLANTSYRTVLFSVFSDGDPDRSRERRQIASILDELTRRYCEERNFSDVEPRSFAIRSALYGAIRIACDGEAVSSDHAVEMHVAHIAKILA